MPLSDALPSLGIFDMLQLATSLVLAGPLLVATALFATNGEFVMAAFTAVLAVAALYLPTYVLKRVAPRSLVPARISRVLDRLPFR